MSSIMNQDNYDDLTFKDYLEDFVMTALAVAAALFAWNYFYPPPPMVGVSETKMNIDLPPVSIHFPDVVVNLPAIQMDGPGQTVTHSVFAQVSTEEAKDLIAKWTKQHLKEICQQ